MDPLIDLFNNFNQYTKENPVLAGVMSLWGVSVFTYLARNVPGKLYFFFKAQFTTRVIFTNSTIGNNADIYNNLMKLIFKNRLFKYSRSISITGRQDYEGESAAKSYGDATVMTLADGFHLAVLLDKLVCIYIRSDDKTTDYTLIKPQTISIVYFGRSHKFAHKLYASVNPSKSSDSVVINKLSRECYIKIGEFAKRDIRSVVLRKDIKNNIIDNLTNFYNNKEYYIRRGFPYKKIIILHGAPGTGKTSLIRSLASHFNKSINIINLSSVRDDAFQGFISEVSNGNFIVLEDFDSCPGFLSRDIKSSEETVVQKNSVANKINALTLATILNTFDGVLPLNDVVIFLTTNDIQSIDPAILRPGRTDHIYEIPYLSDTEVREYINLMWPDYKVPKNITFADVAGSVLYGKYLENTTDPDLYVEKLEKKD